MIVTLVDCKQSQGILQLWEGVDSYMIEADKALCSPDCPCYFSDSEKFKLDEVNISLYKKWTKSTSKINGYRNISSCPQNIKNKVLSNAQKLDSKFNTDTKSGFNETLFYQSFAMFENYFNCSGWCTTEYADSDLTKPKTVMLKYLFTDVGRLVNFLILEALYNIRVV